MAEPHPFCAFQLCGAIGAAFGKAEEVKSVVFPASGLAGRRLSY